MPHDKGSRSYRTDKSNLEEAEKRADVLRQYGYSDVRIRKVSTGTYVVTAGPKHFSHIGKRG